jgi:hypothetical protein
LVASEAFLYHGVILISPSVNQILNGINVWEYEEIFLA